MRRQIFFALIALSATAYACGGVDSDLVSGESDSGSNDGDASSGRRDAGSRDGSVAPADGGVTPSDSGITTHDAGHDHDGGITVPVDSGVGVPALCGTEQDASVLTCTTAAPVCCANQGDGLTANTSFACTSSPGACTGTNIIQVACRDDRDCPGSKVCCGMLDPVLSTYDSVKCLDSCPSSTDAGASYLRFCTPGATDSECTDFGSTCVPSSILPGFNHC